jgi:murein L,D-transpeptidase YcbB/YkuD
VLAQRLAALGDLAPLTAEPSRYEGALVEAVRAFQARHGLAADGVIGKATLAHLEVTPARRARQIELTLERLRWTPLLQGPRMVVINIPEFVLRAYQVSEGRIQVQREMKVVVGEAADLRTPLFDEDMRFVEFSPYWNVPSSIARRELVPRLRRDPDHFAREGFEFVSADGRVDTALSAGQLAAVLAGRSRIRQRPGERNAVGGIKFAFPNRTNIYLHDTPSTRLFERDRRDFSHGCIRVEHPLALAAFVLQDMPGWDEARLRGAMAAGRSSTVRLAQPVPVLIAYGTALVKGGRIHFFDDLYGHDRTLDDALVEARAARRAAYSRE